MSSNTITLINAALSVTAQLIPEVSVVIAGAKAIWLAANPGKTDADWIAALATASSSLTTAADAQLTADGYTTTDGGKTWTRPPTA